MKPTRIRMYHSLVMNYGLYKKMEIFRAKPATKREMAQFHFDEYIKFLSRIAPSNMNSYIKEQHKCWRLWISWDQHTHNFSRQSGVDVDEKPLTTVRNALPQYAAQQFVTEFVAKTCDTIHTNTTKLTLLLVCSSTNENPHLLLPALQKVSSCTSLVVYNNAKFLDRDFKGICRTNIGGKESVSSTVGQFGLGALVSFHGVSSHHLAPQGILPEWKQVTLGTDRFCTNKPFWAIKPFAQWYPFW